MHATADDALVLLRDAMRRDAMGEDQRDSCGSGGVAGADDLRATADLVGIAPRLRRRGSAARLLARMLVDGEVGALPLPSRLHLEITNRCNSLCATCVRTREPEPWLDISKPDIARLLAPLESLTSVALQVNGEPLLYRGLPELIEYIKRRKVHVELNTNGVALRRQRADQLLACGLDQLNVSIDASRPETYARIRGVDALGRIKDNVARFMARRGPGGRSPRVAIWFTVSRHNILELGDVVELAIAIGVDEVYVQRLVHFDFGLAHEDDSMHGRLEAAQREAIAAAVARATAAGLAVRASGGHAPSAMLSGGDDAEVGGGDAEPYRGCRRPWESAVVMANLDVVPCCIATFVGERAEITMGNLGRESWPAIWTGDRYQAFRAALLHGPPPPSCARCGLCWSL